MNYHLNLQADTMFEPRLRRSILYQVTRTEGTMNGLTAESTKSAEWISFLLLPMLTTLI